MDEVFKYQESLTDSLSKENEKFAKINAEHNIDTDLDQIRDYRDKLINLKRSLIILKDRSSKLHRRADKILEDKKREELDRQRSRERREILEKHLEPVVNTK